MNLISNGDREIVTYVAMRDARHIMTPFDARRTIRSILFDLAQLYPDYAIPLDVAHNAIPPGDGENG